ncbi:MAG: tRNA preQ1(34) S-adenosylmethionine ribosyltransferase-isomerase QueA, partial [Anaerolineaceae bacterium]|nr:tRNA preQ1(34) S-adenosylmethionine ribosyltransferase-isomerase QueA [Anaerolineaceae bacterium]
SRLMILRRGQDVIDDTAFKDVGSYLKAGDLLVVNQTRVIPARLFARKVTGGKVELLLLKRIEPDVWEALVGGKGLKPGVKVTVEDGPETEILEDLGASRRLIKFLSPIENLLPNVGEMPLPPYIHTPLANPDRYQTVYSKESGSAAAPTAGLHFTPRLMSELEEAGIQIAKVTLHVGLDTFMPVSEDNPLDHVIHSEWCEVTADTAELINRTKEKGGLVIAVGTTSVRTLESAAVGSSIPNQVSAISGPTQLFILPGFEFKVVDAIITNFHLPQSSLIMLVSAFAGREKVLNAYETAIQRGYRFYSFGDAMLIL